MTKPAAAFLQLVGVFVVLAGIGAESWLVALSGVGLVIWGGAATRKRLRQGAS